MKDHSISVYQARYSPSVVNKYLYTATVKKSKTFYKTTLPYDMIFTKADAYTSDVGPAPSKRGNLGPVPAPMARSCHGPLKQCYLPH